MLSRSGPGARALLAGLVLAAALASGACAVRRIPAGVGPPFLRVEETSRVSDLLAVSPPAWSPDGRTLAVATADAVWTLSLPRGRDSRLAALAGATHVAWAPDGRSITALASGRLYEVIPDAGPAQPLGLPDGIGLFAWAPHGQAGSRELVYVARSGGHSAVWTWRPPARSGAQSPRTGGASGRRLPGTGGQAAHGPVAGVRTAALVVFPARVDVQAIGWPQDGPGLLLALGDAETGRADRLVHVEAARPETVQRTVRLPEAGRAAVVAAAGRFVAYLAGAGGGEQVVAVRTDGTGRRVLAPPGRYSGLAWSPSGALLAFARQDGGRIAIEIVDVLTGRRFPAIEYRPETSREVEALAIVWAPDGLRLAFGTDTGTAAGPVWIARLGRE